jgi:hypothetical protein
MSRTIADALREEGKKEGLQEGALQFAQETLIGVLREKFGRVPRALQQQIKATTDIARLRAGMYRVVKVDSLADFQL